tara:strand:+ start:10121 stop:10591 length:471 start_codon:yes stop_codon:yes gene_type:complete
MKEESVKTRFDLVPWAAVGDIADVLGIGARKYTANNWCRGTEWGRYYAALCRHIFAWWRGEDLDSETGKSHLAHAGCCLLFLMEYQRNSWGVDDRFTGPDGQEFTKGDGLKSAPFDFDYELYKEVLKCHPRDDEQSLKFATEWNSSEIDHINLGLD